MIANESPVPLLNITGLDTAKSATYARLPAGDIQKIRAMKSRASMQSGGFNCVPTNQGVWGSNPSGRANL